MTSNALKATALSAAASLALAAPAAFASRPAQAHTPDTSSPATDVCGNAPGATVFSQFHDRHSYLLGPDGGFENGAADWTLDGASVVDGNEPFDLAGDDGTHSLSLPAGASATTPAICIGKGYPLFRAVAKTDAPRRGRLRVQVVYLSGRGGSHVAGKLRGKRDWRPTKKLSFAIGRALSRESNTGSIALRFTATRGNWQVDDVYVDPRMRH